MKHILKLRDSDQMIINKGKEIRNAYNDCLWKRKETVSLVLFLFVFVPLLFTTFRYVMV